jgi:hypothetical protein
MNNKKKFLSTPPVTVGQPATIFSKYVKNNFKIMPFKIQISDVLNVKYFPPVSREWKNTIYAFNANNLKNLPMYDIKINTLIKQFLGLQLKFKFLKKSYIPKKRIALSFNKIFASKAEIKHTNNKAILTVYVYNREKTSLLKKLKKLNKSFYLKLKKLIFNNKRIYNLGSNVDANANALVNVYADSDNIISSGLGVSSAVGVVTKGSKSKGVLYSSPAEGEEGVKSIKALALLYKNIKVIRKYKLRLSLNKYKFEEKLLYKLKNFLIKYYNKKVEFNIVNVRSVVFHTDFFTKIITSRLKRRKINIFRAMGSILNRAVLPKVNRRIERSLVNQGFARSERKTLNLLANKYKDLSLSFILNNHNNLGPGATELLNKSYYNIIINLWAGVTPSAQQVDGALFAHKDYSKIYEIIFNSINYKNLSGMRLEVKGRLTKRYRADRVKKY